MNENPPPPRPLLPWLRGAVLVLAAVAGTLLVRALDAGLAAKPKDLTGWHILWGSLMAMAVSPGALVCFFVGPESGERARGLAFGGCMVTVFVAILGGAFLWQRGVAPEHGGGTAAWIGLAWCAVALPVSLGDAFRVRFGAGSGGDGEEPMDLALPDADGE